MSSSLNQIVMQMIYDEENMCMLSPITWKLAGRSNDRTDSCRPIGTHTRPTLEILLLGKPPLPLHGHVSYSL